MRLRQWAPRVAVAQRRHDLGQEDHAAGYGCQLHCGRACQAARTAGSGDTFQCLHACANTSVETTFIILLYCSIAE